MHNVENFFIKYFERTIKIAKFGVKSIINSVYII